MLFGKEKKLVWKRYLIGQDYSETKHFENSFAVYDYRGSTVL